MIEALSKERVQLCLSLAGGADRISVYLAISAEAWPVGMVPGFCTVEVRHECSPSLSDCSLGAGVCFLEGCRVLTEPLVFCVGLSDVVD